MAYSLYYMDGFSRQVSCIETFDAGDDREAIALAAAKDWPGLLELWDGIRMVAQLDPDDPPAAA